MRLRWLVGNFAELEPALPPRVQHEVSNRAFEKYLPRSRFIGWTLIGIVLPTLLVVAFVVPMVLGWLGLSGRNGPFLLTIGVVVVFVWPVSALVYGHLHRRAVRRALRDFGYEVCLDCGYRLDGLGDDVARCPECGSRRWDQPP